MKFTKRQHTQYLEDMRVCVAFQHKMITAMAILNLMAVVCVISFWFFGAGNNPQNIILLTVFLTLNVIVFIYSRIQGRRHEERVRDDEIDELTGSLNRRCFEDRMQEEVRRAGRYRFPLTVCRLDVDDYASYKESFGEEKAQVLLVGLSEQIRSTIREADILARYDEDEFCVLLPHTDLVHAEKFISRLLELVNEQLDASFSAGLTPFRAGESKEEFMDRAGNALTHAKKEGKQRVCCVIGNDDEQSLVQF